MTIYQDIILEHYRYPKNVGKLSDPSHTTDVRNSVCGDDIHLDITMKDGVLTDIAFEGTGCAISQASASLLFEYVKGKTKDEIFKIETDTVLQLIGIELSPIRLKCALLSLEALKKALSR
jgi:nitrogen fixation NifU-like protein